MAINESTDRDHPALSYVPVGALIPHFAGLTVIRAIWAEWRIRWQYRTDLERLLRVGPHLIEDVGLTLEEAHREIAKPLWRV